MPISKKQADIAFSLRALFVITCALLLFLVQGQVRYAYSIDRESVAIVVATRGNVDQIHQTARKRVRKDQELFFGDRILTERNSRAAILFSDETQIKINGMTDLTIENADNAEKKTHIPLLNLSYGEAWARFKGPPKEVAFKTPAIHIGIRGTDWFVKVDESNGHTSVIVHDGVVSVLNDYGSEEIGKGEVAHANVGSAPTKVKVVDMREGTQWVYFVSETLRFVYFHHHNTAKLEALLQNSAQTDDQTDREQKLFRAEILHDLGRHKESLQLFNQVLDKTPSHPRALTGTALIQMHMGNWKASRENMDRIAKNHRSPVLLLARGTIAVHDNRFDQALKIMGELERAYGDRPESQGFRVYFALLTGSIKKARTIGQQLMNRFPDDPRIATLLRDAMIILDDMKSADLLTQSVLQKNPNSALAHFDRALYLDHVEDQDVAALLAYKHALKLAPEDTDIITAMGNLLRRMGKYAEALELFQRALDQGSKNATLLYHYALLASQTDQDQKALGLFEAAHTEEGQIESLSGKGIALLKAGHPKEAMESLLEASMMAPKIAENHIYLAIAYYQLGRGAAALATLDEAARVDPRDSMPHVIKAMIHNDRYEPFLAIMEARKAEERLPFRKKGTLDLLKATKDGMSNVASSLRSLGLDYWSLKKSTDILRLDPYDPNAHLFPSVVHTNIANVITAQGEYAQGVIMDPSVLVEPNRNGTILKKPSHYMTGSLRVGEEADKTSHLLRLKMSGFLGESTHLDYLAQIKRGQNLSWPGENHGLFNLKETGKRDGDGIALLMGWHPAYHTDLYARVLLEENKTQASKHENKLSLPYVYYSDGVQTDSEYQHLELGYHRRFNPTSHLLVRPYHLRYSTESLSQGQIDPFSMYPGLLPEPLAALNPALSVNALLDMEETGLQIKHLFNLGTHQISSGVEHLRRRFEIDEAAILQIPPIPGIDSTLASKQTDINQKAWSLYLRDGWQVNNKLLLDVGMAMQNNFVDTQLEDRSFHWSPRIGIAYKPTSEDTLRLAYQKHRFPRDLPIPGIKTGIGLVSISYVAFRPGVGQLETSDVAGIHYDEHAGFGITPKVEEIRLRWEREWSARFFHQSDIVQQKVRNVGNFNFLWNTFNWIAHPRVGIHFDHVKLFNIEYEPNPFEFDLLSKDSTQLKVTYVHPSHTRFTVWHEYSSKKTSAYAPVGSLNEYHRINAQLNWESEDKKFGVNLFWFNILQDREMLPGLLFDDTFAYATLEMRL